MLWKAGIKIPVMYKIGYNNNNCIGCVKGGMGYWNKIRIDFPSVFEATAAIEREIGATCLKDEKGIIYLDELDPSRGDPIKEIIPDCSLICQIEFQEIIDRQVEQVIRGELSISDKSGSVRQICILRMRYGRRYRDPLVPGYTP